MSNWLLKKNFLTVFLALLSVMAVAQKVQEPATTNHPEWSAPYGPFRIAGNLYYVGTYDLAAYLIVTPAGNILINTGLAGSAVQIKKNIKVLGFKLANTKILLNTQAHYDHMGAMAFIKKKTKAVLMADEKDAAVMEDGGSSDYALGGSSSTFEPVKPDRLLHDGDTISLGNMQLVMLHHPGHTKGSCSFLFTVKDEKKSYKVLIANMPTIVTDKRLDSITAYPEAASDYAYTLGAMKNISFDIWVASHASQFDLHTKHKPGAAYNPAAFTDQAGYDASIKELQEAYDEKMKVKPVEK